jgi:hypothetical protein
MKSFAKAGQSPLLNIVVAAFAAASVAFVTFAMPDDLFSSLVQASGLPGFVAAAEPPLGLTARLAVVAVAAGLAFVAVWALLRALDRRPVVRKAAPRREAGLPAAPKLRRADAHPDAPSRRPIFAGTEFGEPAPRGSREIAEPVEVQPEVEQPQVETARPIPAFLVAAAEPDAAEEPLDLVDFQREPASDVQSDFIADSPPETAQASTHDDSISVLMRRLESGLSRLDEGVSASNDAAEAPAFRPQLDERLRSALDDLQRMAARSA